MCAIWEYLKEYRKKFNQKIGSSTTQKELFDAYVAFQGDRLRLMKNLFSKKKTLLELGCSAGMFLYHVKPLMKKVIGIDYDAPAAAYAHTVCKCTTYGVDIRKTPIKKGSQNIVCAFQTLEHVDDPIGFIKTAGEYVVPGGSIAIEVPNLHDALIHLYNLPNHYQFYFHEAHLWYFTEKSLLKVMKKAGFEGKVYFIQDYNVLNHLHWADMDAPQPNNMRGLRPPQLPLRSTAPLGARKKVSNMILSFDESYKKMLAKNKITSNLFFIGKKISSK
jgi:2-polyprenyl-3-methyl-5-hydroxy-6-metoxy-1,4-benzoquinol methylase